MTKEGKFAIYCIEIYKGAKGLTGKDTIMLFSKYRVLDYIHNYYEALNTTGDKYIIEDIDLFIDARKAS